MKSNALPIEPKPRQFPLPEGVTGAATYSRDNEFRFTLTRDASPARGLPGRVLWIMLNPSTATEMMDDPTVRRCWLFTQAWNYSHMTVCNLFAFRATDPAMLRQRVKRGMPLGGIQNMQAVLDQAAAAQIILCAWGADSAAYPTKDGTGPAWTLLAQLHAMGHADKLHHLGLTRNGAPRHPLYAPSFLEPHPWRLQ